jgi:putative transposase
MGTTLSWRETVEMNPAYRDINNWPSIDVSSLQVKKRKKFHRNMKIVAQVLAGKNVGDVAEQFQISHSSVSKMMKRCFVAKPYCEPSLTIGLIPNAHVVKSQRRAELDTFEHSSGSRNAFGHLLDTVPGMRDKLDAMILARLKDASFAQVLSPSGFHGEFKRILEDSSWPRNRYPYTTASLAYESSRLYFHKRVNELRLKKIIGESQDITPEAISEHYALREIQIDEQMTDVVTNVTVELNDELIPLRLSRISLILCIDSDTDCFLGYHVAYSRHPNQQDMLSLLKNVLTPWEPLKLSTPELYYMPDSGFPSGSPYNFTDMAFSTVALDNALIHLATSVRKVVCEDLGSTLTFGIPGKPKRRNWIELAFQTVNKLTHRFASTTGSHTNDPKKESAKNYKSPPIISLRALEEALSIILSNHNSTPQARLGNASPIRLFQHHMQTQNLRRMPFPFTNNWNPLKDVVVCSVKFSESENRKPYLYFYGVRYTGPALNDESLLGGTVQVFYDRQDVRVLIAKTAEGKTLGNVFAPKSWMRFAHSIHTRQYILKSIKSKRFHGKDPLAEYFNYLLENKSLPKYALALTKLHKEANLPSSKNAVIETNDDKSELDQYKEQTSFSKPCLDWDMDWVNQYEK